MKSYIKDAFEVFNRIKDGFTYVSDEEQYGTKEDWRFPESYDNLTGDCDDFAIACRKLLKEKGHECRLVFCRTEGGGGHLICVIGKMALDNRMKFPVEIKYLQHKGYELISASGLNPEDDWHTIL
jgi:predicted transglutaminase-like cysteine proteinase